MNEAKRYIDETDLPIEVTCPTCHAHKTLYFNGGELDRAECHGTVWELRHDCLVLVVTSPKG